MLMHSDVLLPPEPGTHQARARAQAVQFSGFQSGPAELEVDSAFPRLEQCIPGGSAPGGGINVHSLGLFF